MQRKILNISLPSQLYVDVEKMARTETKTKAEFARNILKQYIESQKRWKEIRSWGKDTVQKLKIKNEKDIEMIIDQV